MRRAYLNVALFAALLIAFFVLVGEAVTRISGLGGSVATVAGVNPEAGESIFWGKGKCGTCHHIGGRGSAVRCPDLDGIGALAVEQEQFGSGHIAPWVLFVAVDEFLIGDACLAGIVVGLIHFAEHERGELWGGRELGGLMQDHDALQPFAGLDAEFACSFGFA